MWPPLKIILLFSWKLVSNLSHPGLSIWQQCSKLQFSFLVYCLQFEKDLAFTNLIYFFPKAENSQSCFPMPINNSSIIRIWLPRAPSIKVMVFRLSSEMRISLWRFGLSYSGQFSKEGKNNNNRLHTACSTVAGERIEVLKLNIYSKTLAKMFFTVNNYQLASLKFKALANAGAQEPDAHWAQEPGDSAQTPLRSGSLKAKFSSYVLFLWKMLKKTHKLKQVLGWGDLSLNFCLVLINDLCMLPFLFS